MNRILLAILMLLASACASQREVADEYREALGPDSGPSKTNRTVILFLVDGLSLPTLTQEFRAGHLSNLRSYFVGETNKFYKARSTFPSLTYPAIGSLLTEKPIDKNGLYGNLILKNGRTVDFAAVSDFPELNNMILGQNIFSRLAAKGYRTASFDYAFHSGSTVHTLLADAKAGFSIADQDYTYVDFKTLDSLRLLLKKTPVEKWPDFIFVHIVGVDFTSHDEGPESPSVADYLEKIDSKLGAVFTLLKRSEAAHKREIIGLLTADHGFDKPVTKTVKLEEALVSVDHEIRILNEGKFLSLFFPPSWNAARRMAIMNTMAKNPAIDIVALQDGDHVEIQSQALSSALYFTKAQACGESSFAVSLQDNHATLVLTAPPQWMCVDRLDNAANSLYYPYFIANLAHYFQTPTHPDAVVIAKPGVAFTAKYAGQHGGPTPNEVFVPLLIHGASLPEGSQVPALNELLKFM